MERADIVRDFIKSGYQVGMDALQYFEKNPDRVQEFLSLAVGKLDKPFVTMQTVDSILGSISPSIKIMRTFFRKRREVSPGNISDAMNRRYQMMSEILSKRTDLQNLVSVNRIAGQTKFSLIAMIREIGADRSLIVEDPTGSTTVFVSDSVGGELSYLLEDEVVGIVCDNEESAENKAVKIVYPDLPLPLRIPSTEKDVNCLFISDVHIGEDGFMAYSLEKFWEYLKKVKEETFVFVLGDVSNEKEVVEKFLTKFPPNFKVMSLQGHMETEKEGQLPDPVMVDIGGVKILLSHGDMFERYNSRLKASPENLVVQLLKKRHLSPSFDQSSDMDEEKLFLDMVPDIVVIGHFHKPRTINYKGTTVISLGSFVGEPVFFSVNLKTREVAKIDLG